MSGHKKGVAILMRLAERRPRMEPLNTIRMHHAQGVEHSYRIQSIPPQATLTLNRALFQMSFRGSWLSAK